MNILVRALMPHKFDTRKLNIGPPRNFNINPNNGGAGRTKEVTTTPKKELRRQTVDRSIITNFTESFGYGAAFHRISYFVDINNNGQADHDEFLTENELKEVAGSDSILTNKDLEKVENLYRFSSLVGKESINAPLGGNTESIEGSIIEFKTNKPEFVVADFNKPPVGKLDDGSNSAGIFSKWDGTWNSSSRLEDNHRLHTIEPVNNTSSPIVITETTTPVDPKLDADPAISASETTPVDPKLDADPAISASETTPADPKLDADPAISASETTPADPKLDADPAISASETTPADPKLDADPAISASETTPADPKVGRTEQGVKTSDILSVLSNPQASSKEKMLAVISFLLLNNLPKESTISSTQRVF